jgi:hypothetical protein
VFRRDHPPQAKNLVRLPQFARGAVEKLIDFEDARRGDLVTAALHMCLRLAGTAPPRKLDLGFCRHPVPPLYSAAVLFQ